MNKKNIAIIGAGISGISAAWKLQDKYNVSIFEKNDRIGGHTNTFTIKDGQDAGLGIDTGFIVLNDQTYPNLHQFFKELDVKIRFTNMSFSYLNKKTNFYYSGNGLRGLFANKKNIINLQFYKLIYEIKRFSKLALENIDNQKLFTSSLEEFVYSNNFSKFFVDSYLLPMGSAIWSTSRERMLKFPAYTFLNFFFHHGLLKIKDRPKWQTVVGGSNSYLTKFKEKFNGEIILNSNITIKKRSKKIKIKNNNKSLKFDYVIIATHANQVLDLIHKPTAKEIELFDSWKYNTNKTVLHTDSKHLPPIAARASWNYIENYDQELYISYYSNLLQGINSNKDYIVSLNPPKINEDNILYQKTYQHPLFNEKTPTFQKDILESQGVNNTYYCGSYLFNGFHEDGFKSGSIIADKILNEC